MPENWDPTCYRERAKAWRDKAMTLPEDHAERAVCIELAEGYERLATLLEQRRCHPRAIALGEIAENSLLIRAS